MRIGCAADLFSVLTSGTMGAQLAVLRDIVIDPLRATALGRHENEDLVDLLLRLVPQSFGPLKQAQVMCLMSFDDPRVTDYLIAEFARSRDAATVLHLGKRLSLCVDREFFRPYLWSQNTAQALAAARHCSQDPNLSPQERLRVAILLDEQFEPPPICPDTLELWVEGLAGRHRLRVRQLAEQRQQEILHLWSRLPTLAAAEQDWLVATIAGWNASFLRARLPELLTSTSVSLPMVQQALQLGLPLPPGLLKSDRPQVRAAAIAAGLADQQLEAFLTTNGSAVEAAAAAQRCSPDRLLELLGHPRWEVRAAATEALARLDLAHAAPVLRGKTSSTFLGERVAAVDLLLRLGDNQWLQDNLANHPRLLGPALPVE